MDRKNSLGKILPSTSSRELRRFLYMIFDNPGFPKIKLDQTDYRSTERVPENKVF